MGRLRLETFVNFDFRKLKKQINPIIKKVLKNKLPEDGVRQLKHNIENFKGNPLKESTKKIRKSRGRTGIKPLQDTGKLLNSIKKVEGGVSIMAYGARHHDGFITGDTSMIPNITIAPRPWINYDIDKKTQDEIFKHIMKVLRIRTKKISDINFDL